MRIALVSQAYPPETGGGGISSQTHLKAHGLASLGHDVIVLSHSWDQHRHEKKDHSVHVIRIPGIDSRLSLDTEPLRWLHYSMEVARALSAVHQQKPLDIIDFPEYGCEGYAFLLNRTEWNRIPAIVHLHGPLAMFGHKMAWPDLDSEFYKTGTAMEATCLRLADAIISSSACSASFCAQHYGIPIDEMPVLHLGTDVELFRPLELAKEEHPTILFVGKIVRNKGVDILVKAACLLAQEVPNLRLRILGSGHSSLVEELKDLAHDAGLPHLLELPGFIKREELPAQLSLAHVFAAPSTYEPGPGLVYVEAMACGLPVIGSNGSGATEVIRHGENGLLVPPGDHVALAGALHALLSDSQTREAMGKRAREYALEFADSRKCVKQLESFYCSVICGRKGKEGINRSR